MPRKKGSADAEPRLTTHTECPEPPAARSPSGSEQILRQARLGSCLTQRETERAMEALDKLGIAAVTHSECAASGAAMVIVSSRDFESAKRRRAKFLHGIRQLISGAEGAGGGTGAGGATPLVSGRSVLCAKDGCAAASDGGKRCDRNARVRVPPLRAEMDARTFEEEGDSERTNDGLAHGVKAGKARGKEAIPGGVRHSSAHSCSSVFGGCQNEVEPRLFPKTFSKADVGIVVEIECEDDGMLPILLIKHRKGEVFRVRFLTDGCEMNVDLSEVPYQIPSLAAEMEPLVDAKAAGAAMRSKSPHVARPTASERGPWPQSKSKKPRRDRPESLVVESENTSHRRGAGAEVGIQEQEAASRPARERGPGGPWLRVVGLDILEACAEQKMYLAYLCASKPPWMQSGPACRRLADAAPPAGVVVERARARADPGISVTGGASPAATGCAAGGEGGEEPGEACDADVTDASRAPFAGGSCGCTVLLTQALAGVEVCLFFMLEDARQKRLKKKELDDMVVLVEAMGGRVSLSPPAYRYAPFLPGDLSDSAPEDFRVHVAPSSPQASGVWAAGPHATCAGDAGTSDGAPRLSTAGALTRPSHVVVISSSGSDQCRHLLYALARGCVDSCDSSYDAGPGCRHGHLDACGHAPVGHEASGLVRVVHHSWISRCWEEGCLYETWDYRAKPLDGVTICCSGQGPGRKAGLRSAATLLGADWADELDKNTCSVLIVDCLNAGGLCARQSGGADAAGSAPNKCGDTVPRVREPHSRAEREDGAEALDDGCDACQSSKAAYARRHGIPVCAEQWLWDSIRSGARLDLSKKAERAEREAGGGRDCEHPIEHEVGVGAAAHEGGHDVDARLRAYGCNGATREPAKADNCPSASRLTGGDPEVDSTMVVDAVANHSGDAGLGGETQSRAMGAWKQCSSAVMGAWEQSSSKGRPVYVYERHRKPMLSALKGSRQRAFRLAMRTTLARPAASSITAQSSASSAKAADARQGARGDGGGPGIARATAAGRSVWWSPVLTSTYRVENNQEEEGDAAARDVAVGGGEVAAGNDAVGGGGGAAGDVAVVAAAALDGNWAVNSLGEDIPMSIGSDGEREIGKKSGRSSSSLFEGKEQEGSGEERELGSERDQRRLYQHPRPFKFSRGTGGGQGVRLQHELHRQLRRQQERHKLQEQGQGGKDAGLKCARESDLSAGYPGDIASLQASDSLPTEWEKPDGSPHTSMHASPGGSSSGTYCGGQGIVHRDMDCKELTSTDHAGGATQFFEAALLPAAAACLPDIAIVAEGCGEQGAAGRDNAQGPVESCPIGAGVEAQGDGAPAAAAAGTETGKFESQRVASCFEGYTEHTGRRQEGDTIVAVADRRSCCGQGSAATPDASTGGGSTPRGLTSPASCRVRDKPGVMSPASACRCCCDVSEAAASCHHVSYLLKRAELSGDSSTVCASKACRLAAGLTVEGRAEGSGIVRQASCIPAVSFLCAKGPCLFLGEETPDVAGSRKPLARPATDDITGQPCSPPAGVGESRALCTQGTMDPGLSPLRTPESFSKDGYGAGDDDLLANLEQRSSVSMRMSFPLPPLPLDVVSTPPRT